MHCWVQDMQLGGRGSSGIHKSQRAQANLSDKQKKKKGIG